MKKFDIGCDTVNYKSKLDILLYIIIADLVLGGAGRYIVIGGISARMMIFGITIVILGVQIFTRYNGKIVYTKLYIPYTLLFISFVISTIIGLKNNTLSNVLLTVSGYTYFLFFIYFIQNVRTKDFAVKLFIFFNRLVVVLSCVSIFFYVMLFVYGISFYALYNTPLIDNGFGALGIMGTRLPRVFLKCAVFIPMSLIYYISEYLRKYENKSRNLIAVVILFLGLLSTETIGFWITFLFGGMILLVVIRKSIKKRRIIILFAIFFCFSLGYSSFYKYASTVHMNSYDNTPDATLKQNIIESRLNTGDKSTSVKIEQAKVLLNASSDHIIFGNGLGKIVPVNAGATHRLSTRFEVMWLELLMNNGLFGVIAYFALIIYIMKIIIFDTLRNDIEVTNISISISIGLVMMAIINLSNPFLNNPIGIGYVILCASVANALSNGIQQRTLTYR